MRLEAASEENSIPFMHVWTGLRDVSRITRSCVHLSHSLILVNIMLFDLTCSHVVLINFFLLLLTDKSGVRYVDFLSHIAIDSRRVKHSPTFSCANM